MSTRAGATERTGRRQLQRIGATAALAFAALGCGGPRATSGLPRAAVARAASGGAGGGVARARPAARPAVPARAELVDGPPMGTDHPVVVPLASPDGRWAVLCEARQDSNHDGRVEVMLGHHGDVYGDAMAPYLVLGGGPGGAIDDYVGADDAGRYLAFVRGGRLVLLDTARGAETDLSARGADAGDDDYPFGGHRAASFDAAGRRMIYLRARGGRTLVVVRDLASGDEREIDPGAGRLFRAVLDDDGEWVFLRVIARDTDGNGRLEPWRPRTSLSARRCRGPIRSYSTGGARGDEPVMRVAPAATAGTAREVAGALRAFGPGLLVRAASGAIELHDARGRVSELAPAACRARVLHGDVALGRLLVACAAGGGAQMPLMVVGAGGYRRALGLGVPREHEHEDNLEFRAGRFLFVGIPRPGAPAGAEPQDTLIDMAAGTARPSPRDETVLASAGTRLLVARGERAFVRDVASDTEQPLPERVPTDAFPRQQGPFVLLGPAVIDLARGALLGTVEGRALMLGGDGRVLVPASDGETGVPIGPVQWRAPRP